MNGKEIQNYAFLMTNQKKVRLFFWTSSLFLLEKATRIF